MKVRPLSGALLAAGLSVGVTQAQADANFFDQALELDEQIGYALIESILSLIAMDVEHRGKCYGYYDWEVKVTNFHIDYTGGGVEVNQGWAYASVDDVYFTAEIQKINGEYDPYMITKGTKIVVNQETDWGANQLGNTWVGVYTTPPYNDDKPFQGFFAYDLLGQMMSGLGAVSLDEDHFDEMVIKDFWTPDPDKDDGPDRVLDEGYELINKLGYPRAKWDQQSDFWRSNGGDGMIIITKRLIAPDPYNFGCEILLTALIGNYGAGLQSIGGEVRLTDLSSR